MHKGGTSDLRPQTSDLQSQGPRSEVRRLLVRGLVAPLLVAAAEHALVGKRIDEHVAALVGELAAKTAKPLTTSALTPEYRREVIKVYAKRAVMAVG